jgi:hypothetical protein
MTRVGSQRHRKKNLGLHDTTNRNKGMVWFISTATTRYAQIYCLLRHGKVLVYLFLGRDRFLLPDEMNSYTKTCRGVIYGIIAKFGRMGSDKLQIKFHNESKTQNNISDGRLLVT